MLDDIIIGELKFSEKDFWHNGESLPLTWGLPQACNVLVSPLNKNIFVVRLGRKSHLIRRPAASPDRCVQS
jgi:hypothetical protein